MQLIVDRENLGTPENRWLSSSQLAVVKPLGALTPQRILVVAPHPDDEVLGAGGIIQHALARGIRVKVVAVTDGEQSHPSALASVTCNLARRRVSETKVALRRLGWDVPDVLRLRLPDGRISARRAELHETLSGLLRPGDWCLAPWHHDGHPDHDACGEVARSACHDTGTQLMSYLIWTWHWATPGEESIPWQLCRRLELTPRERARKRWATKAFSSQISSLSGDWGELPVLPAPILRRFWRSFEVYVEGSERSDAID
jgi:LmbE family N-acetylglucosaminyl deacetylase